jgi:phosphate transport system permease protein
MLQALGYLPMGWLLFAGLAMLTTAAFLAGRMRANGFVLAGAGRLHSRPNYHGYFVAACAALPSLLISLAYFAFGDELVRAWLVSELPPGIAGRPGAQLAAYLDQIAFAAKKGASGGDETFRLIKGRYLEMSGAVRIGVVVLMVFAAVMGAGAACRKLSPRFRARPVVESGIKWLLMACAASVIATTIGIFASLIFESLRFFTAVPITDFLFGTAWNAQTSDAFGAVPLMFGTVAIAGIAMVIAAPVGLFAAIYLSEYASGRFRGVVKPILELLAGIPTVVYGFFALLLVAPAVRSVASHLNGVLIETGLRETPLLSAQPTSALAAGIVMGVMIIPFVSSLADDVLRAVPRTLRDGALAVGATKSEMIKDVALPAAFPGIVASLLLGVSRAIGETMIVVMAAGQRANITLDPTSDLTTITAQIVSVLTGDTAFDNPRTLSAFALGLLLFLVTLVFNLIALRVVQKYKATYE